jgi:hypothetical protein
MKRRNRRNNGAPVAFLLSLLLLMGSCQPGKTASVDTDDILVFEGTLEKLGRDPGITSGRVAAYRLAKYRVERICSGKYDGKEIVVDHLVFDGKEFEGVNEGDRVCVSTKVLSKVLARYDAEGIRDPSDVVNKFYEAADKVVRSDQRKECCEFSQ